MPSIRLALGTCLLVLLASIASASASLAASSTDAVPGEIIVKYRAGLPAARRARVMASVPAARSLRALELIGGEQVSVPVGSEDAAIARLQADPDVVYAEPNWRIHLEAIPDDPLFSQLWNLRNTGQGGAFAGDDIHAWQAWDLTTGDPELKIGVLDTGIDYTHPDLAGNMWTNPGEIPGNGLDDDENGYPDDVHGFDFVNGDGDPMDDHFHGTHVAGTIGAVGNDGAGIVGVNWHCRMVAIKFLDNTGNGSEGGAIAALQYALTVGVRVTNNSWGNMPGGQGLLDAIDACGQAGQLFVNAAGNNGWNLDFVPVYPTCYPTPYMITVAATDGRDLRPSWSNYGATVVNLGAPGMTVYSCKPGGLYQNLNGTSMAAPHVTGAVALAMAYFPHATNLQIKSLVLGSVDSVASMAITTTTGGRLNAYRMLLDGDAIAPARIEPLEASAVDSTTVHVTWTATGDDTTAGTATAYDLRIATFPLDSLTFASATPVVVSTPQASGMFEATTVAELLPGTTYHLAIRAIDDFGNASGLSNVADVTTPSGDVLGVMNGLPARLALRVLSANPGAGEARFELRLPQPGPLDVGVYDVSGRRVATLASGAASAGVRTLLWDGRGRDGAPLAAGVYLVRARTAAGEVGARLARVR